MKRIVLYTITGLAGVAIAGLLLQRRRPIPNPPSRDIRKTYRALHDIDLHKANERLRAVIAKAASMYSDENSQMMVAVSNLRNLQQLELQPYIECPDLRSPEDNATTVRKRLNDLRYEFHKAFLTDIGSHQALLTMVKVMRLPIAYIHSPFFSEEENSTM
jgi:hypothetical protein